MKNLFLLLVLSSFAGSFAQGEKGKILPKEIQIKTALLPVPEADSSDTMVYGYNADGDFVVLREGTSNLVCLSDDPNREGISVSCYSKKLEPFMKRGRELRAQGKDVMEIRKIRGDEVSQGTLDMPKEPSMMYVYYGSDEDYDSSTGDLANGKFRYVIYIPFATTESTGLPDKPHAKGMPWLMDPGTHRAHIMVGPN
ncbi:hypothetical protein [Maribacter cobaltidurans]|uniref:Uncharacterized protein n=1 Tax=Maribacter cobaltidurans TaxID=1178778 RepID=A0A223V7Z0_9FLAO|nr:hypothetical protein [Maribacter cobaltidurans]ASV31250.1 hypothetical protein CJ263_14070 [Maribacter cobaltidurans]GGD83884.1 hypothetical protein GCM10011412_22030 [Maribacter cobaltidurans]